VKTVNLLKALGIALCVATASSAYAQASDAAMADTTASSTARTKAVKKSNVYVRARGGAVTLTGSVPDGAQIPQAEDVAKNVAGVKSVSNKLTVAPPNGGG
jgi:osmotically-inducible protein OsmY